MDLYADTILDHYKHPRHKGALGDADVSHQEINVACGDTVTVGLRFGDDGRIDIGWEGEGCAISQAGMSLLAEALSGKTLQEAEQFGAAQMKELLGVPVGMRRFKCAFLALHALKNALRVRERKAIQGWEETVGVAQADSVDGQRE